MSNVIHQIFEREKPADPLFLEVTRRRDGLVAVAEALVDGAVGNEDYKVVRDYDLSQQPADTPAYGSPDTARTIARPVLTAVPPAGRPEGQPTMSGLEKAAFVDSARANVSASLASSPEDVFGRRPENSNAGYINYLTEHPRETGRLEGGIENVAA